MISHYCSKICIVICFLANGINMFAQGSINNLFDYMKVVYKLEDNQINTYISLKNKFDAKNEQLKKIIISSDEYILKQNELFNEFYANVKLVFNEEQYFRWTTCIEKIERYLVLSETRFVRRAKLRALYKAETMWLQSKKELWDSNIDDCSKYLEEEKLYESLNNTIKEILLSEAEWYLNFKLLSQSAKSNMDLYSVSYNDGFKIAEIEKKYSILRHEILDIKNLKWSEKEIKLSMLESKKKEDMSSNLSSDVATRWMQVNENKLNTIMERKYGLKRNQIDSYRIAYNKYAIEEYKILNEYNNKSMKEKETLLRYANNMFCSEVKVLFNDDKYKEWFGWRMYSFERRLKAKGIIL